MEEGSAEPQEGLSRGCPQGAVSSSLCSPFCTVLGDLISILDQEVPVSPDYLEL